MTNQPKRFMHTSREVELEAQLSEALEMLRECSGYPDVRADRRFFARLEKITNGVEGERDVQSGTS